MKIDPQIKEDLKLRLKEDLAKKRRRIVITCAYKMTEEEKRSVFNKFPALKDSSVDYKIDAGILAGYLIQIGSRVTDLSLKGQLQNFKNLIYEIDR